jgi:hypothetical protein
MNAMLKPAEMEPHRGPLLANGLTEKQNSFVQYFVQGHTQTKAAKLAGYSSPGQDGHRLVRTPSVAAAIGMETERMLATEGRRVALQFMMSAPMNEKLPGAVRYQASKWLMEASGHGLSAQRAALGLPDMEKPLAEMSITELDAFLAAGRGAIAQLQGDKMRTIEGEARNLQPDGVGVATQVIEHKGD